MFYDIISTVTEPWRPLKYFNDICEATYAERMLGKLVFVLIKIKKTSLSNDNDDDDDDDTNNH